MIFTKNTHWKQPQWIISNEIQAYILFCLWESWFSVLAALPSKLQEPYHSLLNNTYKPTEMLLWYAIYMAKMISKSQILFGYVIYMFYLFIMV